MSRGRVERLARLQFGVLTSGQAAAVGVGRRSLDKLEKRGVLVPSEAANNLIKRIKRIGFGFTRFRNYRVRVLLYAGRPNWDLLATITPR